MEVQITICKVGLFSDFSWEASEAVWWKYRGILVGALMEDCQTTKKDKRVSSREEKD